MPVIKPPSRILLRSMKIK